jgi:hypothetical protein
MMVTVTASQRFTAFLSITTIATIGTPCTNGRVSNGE